MENFKPEFFHTIKNYNREKFLADLMAGVIVGIIALPLAIAFGIASGVAPEQGLFTAIIAGFIISFLGGSRVQIGGPTGAFIVIVYGIVQQFGVTGLAVATIMAGVMLVAMGVLKLGAVIKFIPYPVVVGFTSGIALTIFATQIKDVFGLDIENVPADFIHKWIVYAQNFASVDWWTFAIAILSILVIIVTPKFSSKIPGSLVAIIVMTIIVYFLKQHMGIQSIDTIGDRYTIKAALPKYTPYEINYQMIQTLLPVAFTIAMLGAIESLLSATVADGVIGKKHNSNTELIGQGVANIITPLFGGIPATGAIARTMANINNGGRTPVAGMIHALVLLLILLFLGDLTKHIPMPTLAAVLVIVAYNMSEWRTFRSLIRGAKSDVAVLLTTFSLTVIFDLTIAIQVGLLLAIVLFIRRISAVSSVSVFEKEYLQENEEVTSILDTENLDIPKGVAIYEIEGPFFFGVANKFEETIKQMGDFPKVRIIRMRKVPFMDSTGANNLRNVINMSHKDKTAVLLSGVNESVKEVLLSTQITQLVGEDHIFDNVIDAIEKAKNLLSPKE